MDVYLKFFIVSIVSRLFEQSSQCKKCLSPLITMESNGDQLTDLPTPGQCTISDDLSPSPGDLQTLMRIMMSSWTN